VGAARRAGRYAIAHLARDACISSTRQDFPSVIGWWKMRALAEGLWFPRQGGGKKVHRGVLTAVETPV